MKTKRQRERTERRRASASRRAEKQAVGPRPYLKLPEGAEQFEFKKKGPLRLDIVEYVVGKGNPNAKEGELFYELTFYVHRGVGPDNEMHLCPKKTFNKPCPICEHRAALASDPDADEDELKALRPSERQLFNVINPKQKKKGIRILDISNFFFGKFIDAKFENAESKKEKAKLEKFASPDEGLQLKVDVEEGSFGGRTHYKAAGIEFKERDEQYDASLTEDAYTLEELLRPTKYKDLKELFHMEGGDDDDDEDEDDDLDDEDTDDDDDDDSDDDEDESDDEDEDDSEEDDEEDDDDDDSEDDDSDDDEEEDEDDDAAEVKKGSRVKFTYKGKKLKGTVKRIKHDMAYVKTKDRSDPYLVAPDDCTVL